MKARHIIIYGFLPCTVESNQVKVTRGWLFLILLNDPIKFKQFENPNPQSKSFLPLTKFCAVVIKCQPWLCLSLVEINLSGQFIK